MESNNNTKNSNHPFADNLITSVSKAEETNTNSFDLIFWLIKFVKYWWLFLIVCVLACALGLLQNKSWEPKYQSTTRILIEENNTLSGAVTSPVVAVHRNAGNQMAVYLSHDLITTAVSKMSVSNVIYRKGRFKDVNLYKSAAIEIESDFIASDAYGLEFEISGIDENSYKVSFLGNKFKEAFEVTGKYDEMLQHSLFYIMVNKTVLFAEKFQYNFRFVSTSQWVESYKGRLSVRNIEGTDVMEVTLIGSIPEQDVDFLNNLNNQFFSENLERKNNSSSRAIEFINEQLSVIKDSISVSESKLNQYQISSGIYTSAQSGKTTSTLDELDKKKIELRFRKEYLADLNKYLKENKGEMLVDPAAMGVDDPKLSSFVASYNDLLFQLKTLKPENPIFKRYSTQLQDIRSALLLHITSMQGTLSTEESNVSTRLREAMGEMASMPVKERRLLAKERDFKINDSYYTFLQQRKIESQIQMASNSSDNMVLDKPRTITLTNRHILALNYLVSVGLGIVLVILFIVIKEMFFNFKVKSRDEIEKVTGLPIIGTIERADKKTRMVVKTYPKSGFAESFRNIRARLEYLTQKEKPISILITSTEPKDGKTFISSNMASVYQLTGRKTVIVDCDLRRPALSKELGYGTEKGLSNYLIGQVDLEEITYSHPEYDFDVIPAGTIPPNPSELIHSDDTKELMEKLKEKYDYIILDCSPVGLVTDAHFLANLVDVVLYVVRNEKTNKNFLKYTVKELREDSINNMVIVYNDVNLRTGYQGYGGKRYYGKSSYYIKHDTYYHNDYLES